MKSSINVARIENAHGDLYMIVIDSLGKFKVIIMEISICPGIVFI